MPAKIVDALITYLQAVPQLDSWVWDGEVPRFDPNGKPVRPGSVVAPSNFPAIKLYEVEPGFTRGDTFVNAYEDVGAVMLKLYALGRAAAEALMDRVEVFFANEDNWVAITATMGRSPGGGPGYGINQMWLRQWWCGQDARGEQAERTSAGELIYRADMLYQVHIHGSVVSGPTSRV